MSNRSDQGRQDNNNKGFTKTHNHNNFLPKNPNPTLSTSLRQTQPSIPATTSGVPNRGQNGNFVKYLPQDEAVAAGLGAEDGALDPLESQRVVDLLNTHLSRLLKCKPKQFWTQVAADASLHEFLDSFLQFRNRWYDFPHRGVKGIVAGVIVGERDLSRRVFMVLYRISSNKDPGARPADALSLRDHGVLLQEKKLLELPKLLDICAIYYHENEELTRSLVRNAFSAQPWLHNNLTAVISHFLGIVSTMHERCSSSLEVLFSSGNLDDHNAAFLQADLLEVMDFINDAIVSMDSFVSAYEPAAVFFSCPVEMSYGNEELLSLLARLHDSLIPSLQKGFRLIFSDKHDGTTSNILVSLKMLKIRLVKFGWQLLHLCYLSDEVFRDGIPLPAATKMFPANVEDPVIRADILVQTIRDINTVSSHSRESHQKETFLQDVERNFNILSGIERLKDSGWIFIDNEQFQYLSGMMSSVKQIYKDPYSATAPVPNQSLLTDEDAAIAESNISQIRDLFPDYGKGFLAACLEVYDQNPEEVIQRILEGTLHQDLQSLDTSLETLPPAKPTTVSGNDKGKGKLIDSTSAFSNPEVVRGKQQTEGSLMSSSASLGKFIRKSRADLPDLSILDKKDEKDTSKTAAMILQYEYEDEYDDSFDDLGLSVADSGLEENEILGDQINAKSGKSWATESGNSAKDVPDSKWGSRRKPQYYVKDGKNYSYKVAGAVAVANSGEASLVTQAQKELIHGLGRGGNLPLGAVKKLTDSYKEDDNQSQVSEMEGNGIPGKSFGRGSRKEGGRQIASHQQQQQQQQQQQNLLQPNQLQSSQQPVIQTSSVMQQAPMMQTSLPSIQHNQQSNNVQQSTQSVLQQHSQVIRQQQPQQTSIIHQQQTPMTQQSILPPQQQQQQQLMGAQGNASNMQHTQILGTQSNVSDLQQPQRLLAQQNNLSNLQQQQQQLINQQNNLSNMHQQLGNNVPGLQPQQVLGPQSGNSGMQTSQHSAHVLQQSQVQIQPQSQQNASNLLPSQVQQSQTQPPQQQLMPQIQSQPAQLQQQLGLQQQPNSLQRDMQQRLQASGPLLQQSTVLDQQKQLYQSQRPLPETSSTSLDSTAQTGQSSGGDWQEEVYQKIKSMKESYLPELNEMYQKIASKLQQDSLPQQPKSEQLDKLKVFKMMLERIITFLQVSKSNISPSFKEKLGSYEKQIINFINTNRPKKNIPGQLPPPHMHSMSQSQSQVTQVQSHENQINSQLQTSNMQGSVATMQQNNMPNMQHNSLSGVSTAQQSKMNSMQPNSNLDSGPGNAVNSLQQVPVSSLQQNPVSASQQTNVNSLSSQSGVNVIQSNLNPLQQGSSMLQHQQLKQQEQQMLHNQQIKQQYQRQLIQRKQQQIMQQQQQQQQQLHQTAKQQLPAQLPTHQLQQLHQMNDANDIKMRQGIGVKPGVFQSHLTSSQRSSYPHQQMKGSPFPVSSPQLLQATSPQIPQHSSPQVDQQNHLPSLTKVATPLQSANSPFVVPTPSPPLAPSPMPGDSEKPISGISLISNAVNIGYQQSGGATAPAQSLAIGTPGISASPLLAEFTGPDGALGNAFVSTSGKSTVTEQPIERLIKAVKSMSSKTLCSAVSDIGSVVSMNDRIAGSAPGNGSRAAVGEDLVAMTNCRLQARNFIAQDGANGTRRMKRYTYATPLNVVSSAGSMNDSIKQLTASEVSDLDSTATSRFKMPRVEANHSLLEEIREVNQRLIDTVVDISNEEVDPTAAAAAAEGTEGTIVKCSYNAVALSPSLKSQYASVQMSPIQPLRLLVPTNYPNCSPILLDKFPVESGKENEDLSVKAKSRFSISLRSLSQPMSLGEIARTWDVCARTVISEHAQQSGGGSFSSKYGTWENCLTT